MKRTHKYPSKKLPQRFLQAAIIKFLRRKVDKSYSAGTITAKLKTKNSKDSVKSALKTLHQDGKLIRDKEGRYALHPAHMQSALQKRSILLEGRVDLTASGGAYIIVEGQERDIYVPPKYVNNALQGDTVEVTAIIPKNGRRPEGKITRVIKRKRINFIGVFQQYKKYAYVYVETPKFKLDVKIMPDDYGDAEDDQAVVVEVIDYSRGRKQEIIGRVTEILDTQDRNEYEMNAILINNGFEVVYPPEVLAETAQLTDVYGEDEISRRRDIRDVLTFTIDPKDAKDFDDALSYRKLDDGQLEVGVHIADVTHFVRPGTALDKDALHRSTSVYLVDRVCAMLPEKISNELCSLRPHEDKLCFSAIFTLSDNNKVVDTWMGKTIIHSDHRYTYEDAQDVIESGEGEHAEAITRLNEIAKKLNKKRFQEGSINFETEEVRFELDEKGAPIRLYKKTRKDAHKMIEEWMLLANKAVAKYMSKKDPNQEVPYVYRVHDLPDPDRLMELAILASECGIKLNFDSPKHITASLNSLSDQDGDQELLQILKPMAIRCMAKAAYSSDNIGHYGLGFEYYSHFTSPIRRYADVLAHRILHDNLTNTKRVNKSELEEKCHYISLKERDAITAERESIKYKQVEYYSSRLGTIEQGVIRNMTDRGMFIELVESQADGYISFDELGESVITHPARIKVTGRRSGGVWRIGDRIPVEIYQIDLDKRQIDLRLATDNP